jgi:hypothetical protein
MPRAPLENIEFEKMTLAVPEATRTPFAILKAIVFGPAISPIPIELPDEPETLTPLAPLPSMAVPLEFVPIKLFTTWLSVPPPDIETPFCPLPEIVLPSTRFSVANPIAMPFAELPRAAVPAAFVPM